MHIGIPIIRAAGRAPAAADVLSRERGAAERSMAREGTGRAPTAVKGKVDAPFGKPGTSPGGSDGDLAYRP